MSANRQPAPLPSAEEAAIIDRFGIFAEERVVEEVARAIHDADEVGNYPKTWPWEDDAEENRADYRRLAVAAVAAYRATQDGGAEEAVRQETVVMCTHDGRPEHPWRPGEGCPDALTAGTWSVR